VGNDIDIVKFGLFGKLKKLILRIVFRVASSGRRPCIHFVGLL